MPLGTEVDLGPDDIVLDWDPAPPTERDTTAPTFRPTLLWYGRPFQQLLSSCAYVVTGNGDGLNIYESYSMSDPVSTGMGHRLRTGKTPRYVTRPTRPPTLSRTRNEYGPKCGDALPLGSKGRRGSFHLRMHAWVACKTV